MRRYPIIITALFSFAIANAFGESHQPSDGKTRTVADGTLEAWDAENEEWVDVVSFWERYADRRGGLTWGRRTDYPPYADVKELDTMIIELDSGPCLMEFFHTRWRRANDVRRWDPAFNDYAGCPHVFD